MVDLAIGLTASASNVGENDKGSPFRLAVPAKNSVGRPWAKLVRRTASQLVSGSNLKAVGVTPGKTKLRIASEHSARSVFLRELGDFSVRLLCACKDHAGRLPKPYKEVPCEPVKHTELGVLFSGQPARETEAAKRQCESEKKAALDNHATANQDVSNAIRTAFDKPISRKPGRCTPKHTPGFLAALGMTAARKGSGE